MKSNEYAAIKNCRVNVASGRISLETPEEIREKYEFREDEKTAPQNQDGFRIVNHPEEAGE